MVDGGCFALCIPNELLKRVLRTEEYPEIATKMPRGVFENKCQLSPDEKGPN